MKIIDTYLYPAIRRLCLWWRTPKYLQWNPLEGMPTIIDPLPRFSDAPKYIGKEFLNDGALYRITKWEPADDRRDILAGDGIFTARLVRIQNDAGAQPPAETR